MSENEVIVYHKIQVNYDESKFNDEFMKEFRQYFYQFYTIDEHINHLAQLYARGLCDNHSFIEGYGWPVDMGVSFKEIEVEVI